MDIFVPVVLFIALINLESKSKSHPSEPDFNQASLDFKKAKKYRSNIFINFPNWSLGMRVK